jgi:hypothetical protein
MLARLVVANYHDTRLARVGAPKTHDNGPLLFAPPKIYLQYVVIALVQLPKPRLLNTQNPHILLGPYPIQIFNEVLFGSRVFKILSPAPKSDLVALRDYRFTRLASFWREVFRDANMCHVCARARVQ